VPDEVLAAKDPIATELLARFNQIPMPNLGVSEGEAAEMLRYLASQSAALASSGAVTATAAAGVASARPPRGWSVQRAAGLIFLVISIVIGMVFWRVIASTRDPVPKIDMDTAYALRKRIFFAATLFVVGTLAATLSRTPYAGAVESPDHVIYATAKQFSFVYSAEPVTNEKELGEVTPILPLTIPSGALVEFRVTSLDVNHGFAIYTPSGDVLSQTQAMPGYTNRLLVRFPAPGKYTVLCLEYCGLPHHLMRSEFIVE
jgi:cytochrome c oxidase subunit 2